MNLEQKQEILLRWKQSGLSLPKWWKENVDELGLPHLSTLYAWAKQLGFSTEPGADVTNEHNEEHEEHDETGDSDDSQEEDDKEPQDGSQGSAEREIDDEKEIDEEPEASEEDVIAKDRIEQLAPVTVPEPVQAEAPVDEPKTGINTQTLVIIGGAAILGIGAFLLIRKIRKRPEPKQEQNTQNTQGGNPFGYITIDEF